MRNKIIRITVIVLMFIAGVFYWINISIKNGFKEETKIENTHEEVVSDENKNQINEQDSKNNATEGKEAQKTNDDKTTETIEKTTPSKDTKEVKQSNQSSKQEIKQDEEATSIPIVEAKKQEIWEALGMTKDQYYNQPMYSWERIDFKSRAECVTYGDSYEPYLKGEVLYNCRDVTSPSGKYLGTMFDVEKLN